MDQLLSLGKQAFQAYEDNQQGGQHGGQQEGQQAQYQGQGPQGHSGQGGGDYGVQGGAQFNSNDNGRTQGQGMPSFDNQQIANHAAQQSGGDSSMFEQAMQHAQNMGQNHHQHPVDENLVQQQHEQAYGGDASSMGASAMGAAAAMQALKAFTQSGGSAGGGGMGGMSSLISMAMSEGMLASLPDVVQCDSRIPSSPAAAKLSSSSGGPSSGTQQDVINSASATMMKLLLKSQMGGNSGGGMSGLLGMASKFM